MLNNPLKVALFLGLRHLMIENIYYWTINLNMYIIYNLKRRSNYQIKHFTAAVKS